MCKLQDLFLNYLDARWDPSVYPGLSLSGSGSSLILVIFACCSIVKKDWAADEGIFFCIVLELKGSIFSPGLHPRALLGAPCGVRKAAWVHAGGSLALG